MQVNRWEAKTRRSGLIVAAERGEEVLIARNGVPVARIVPYGSPRVKPPDVWKGLVPYSPDWRSAEIERMIERLWIRLAQHHAGPGPGGTRAGRPP